MRVNESECERVQVYMCVLDHTCVLAIDLGGGAKNIHSDGGAGHGAQMGGHSLQGAHMDGHSVEGAHVERQLVEGAHVERQLVEGAHTRGLLVERDLGVIGHCELGVMEGGIGEIGRASCRERV